MFSKTIESKPSILREDGVEMLDLTMPIFNDFVDAGVIVSYYKLTEEMRMRPDLATLAGAGDVSYTEMVLKYSGVKNPFSLDYGDVVVIPSVNSMYKDLSQEIMDGTYNNSDTNSKKLIENYHKYIDKDKVEKGTKSEKINRPEATPQEANISKTGESGITYKNGKLYFGSPAPDASTDAVDCATNGMTVGQFLSSVIKNAF